LKIYCGKSIALEGTCATQDSTLAYNVVLNSLVGHEGKGHIITMGNYFASIGLFKSLLERGIYAIRTLWTNQVGISLPLTPKVLKHDFWKHRFFG